MIGSAGMLILRDRRWDARPSNGPVLSQLDGAVVYRLASSHQQASDTERGKSGCLSRTRFLLEW